ncbi:hypothetical protein QQZ08_009259 [Neonectria magnoliae]|uniref:Protein YOP1 n=1 Tax=Neonectria magnoliae TaxID=2732573 RepID=A0ABR1HNU6_9HYPO
MFDLLPMLLSSVASFLFPIFASYKALKTSDPAELTPWLMYWVVISCFLLAESWVWFIISWIPFYGYFRLLFLLYLILPQTQGARYLYEEQVHPFLRENEAQIDEFITSAHNRLTDAGIAYFKLAIEAIRTKVLGLPPSRPCPPPPESAGPQSYTQSLLSRFSVPAAKWGGSANPGSDFYSLLSSAVAAATSSGAMAGESGATSTMDYTSTAARGLSNSGALIPPHLRDSNEKMTFITAQRDRLNIVLSALDREAQELRTETQRAQDRASTHRRAPSMTFDGPEDDEPTQRPPSAYSGRSGLSKSRSEADFEQIDYESSADDSDPVRRRRVPGGSGTTPGASASSWAPWGWGGSDTRGGTSSGMER